MNDEFKNANDTKDDLMRLKSFHGRTMANAMSEVRKVLGDDAIIVATREEEDGFRVTAAIEDVEMPTADLLPVNPSEQGFEEHETTKEKLLKPDISGLISDCLYQHGLPPAMVEYITSRIDGMQLDDPIVALGTALDSSFNFAPIVETPNKPIVLVGPSGAGKTVTIVKMLAQARLAGKTAGIITTDIKRTGSIEQLTKLCQPLGLRLMAVEDRHVLADALTVQSQNKTDIVLIDTHARNPFDRADMAELEALLQAGNHQDGLDPMLVLPAGLDVSEAAEIGEAFSQIGVQKLIATKLDVSRRLGSILSAAAGGELLLTEASASPKVAEALTPLNPMNLARKMMPNAPEFYKESSHDPVDETPKFAAVTR